MKNISHTEITESAEKNKTRKERGQANKKTGDGRQDARRQETVGSYQRSAVSDWATGGEREGKRKGTGKKYFSLEDFMPPEFIYREKSGFVPPFVSWLTDRDFNHKVRDILLDRKGHVVRIVPPQVLDELLSDALKGRDLRSPVLNFLWGAIFTEMWILLEKEKGGTPSA